MNPYVRWLYRWQFGIGMRFSTPTEEHRLEMIDNNVIWLYEDLELRD